MRNQYPNSMMYFFILLALFFSHATPSDAQFKTPGLELSSLLTFEDKKLQPLPFLHYNRVEGFFLGAGLKYKPEFLMKITLTLQSGYGISNEEWRYKFGVEREFFDSNKFTVGAYALHLTCSLDDWYIGWIENSLAGIFFKEDFMDYFSRKGMLTFISQELFEQRVRLRLEAATYEYQSMNRSTNWALFGKNKNFPENPAITPGNENTLRLILTYDGRDNPLFPTNGWLCDGIYEHTARDFHTKGLFLTIRRFQPTFGSQCIRAKTMLGTRQGSLANQHLMDLGGLGTLPGFDDKEFQNGNRFLLFNLDYSFNRDLLSKLPFKFIPLFEALSASLFIESGWLHGEHKNAGLLQGFQNATIADLKSNAGFSLSLSDELFLIQFAKRTDRADDAWRVLVRLMHKF